MKKNTTLLGGLSVEEFLRDYWQKKPLLIRQALPGFAGLLSPKELLELACDPDAQARAVVHRRNKWELYHAPFEAEDFEGMEKQKWTVLVQGVNHYLASGAELLKHFNFVPHARLDDLMVSYAPKGGGVGPHFDSYDVFLLQGHGHRRWQISQQKDRTLIEGAPLRILQDFRVEDEWVLEPGDMLYLPPHCAHNGIAEDDCMTYSIGFRTPAYQELAEQFMVYMQDHVSVEGMYADPDLKAQKHPSEISPEMLQQVENAINQVRWNERAVADFLGCYLSEPKPHIFFEAPARPINETRFQQALHLQGVELNLKTQMLCHANSVFINGESNPVSATSYRALRELADNRALPPSFALSAEAFDLLYQWYQAGYLAPAPKRKAK
jgi:50S ribosomal protein L16 3-hydroxylase